MAEIPVDFDEIERLADTWYDDPVAFCNDVFDEPPREWQPEVLAALAAEGAWTAVAACRGAGKTRLAAYVVLWFLFTRGDGTLVYTFSPTWPQVWDVLWRDVKALWTNSRLPLLCPTWQVLRDHIDTGEATPKWRAIGVASDKQDNIEGRHAGSKGAVLLVIDEAKSVDEAFFASLLGMLGANGRPKDNRLLAIGTPGPPRGWFYKAFSTQRELWTTFQISGKRIERVQSEMRRVKALLGEDNPYFRQQWYAEFTGADEGSVIGLSSIERARDRFTDWRAHFSPQRSWQRVMALDPAGRGDDESVLSFRWGPVLLEQEAWRGKDEMWTAHHVVDRAKAFKPDIIVIDEVGIGAGIRSRVQGLCGHVYKVRGWNSGRSARNREQYANKKSEAVFTLKKLFESDEIVIPDSPTLIAQLTAWTWDYSQQGGKTKVIDPDDSPDYADSMLMAFMAERLGGGIKGIGRWA